MEVWRHLKTGGSYTVLTTAVTEASGEEVVVYQGEDGRVWTRPSAQFYDGRFERVPRGKPEPAPKPTVLASPLGDLPLDLAQAVVATGCAKWERTEPLSAEEHGKLVTESVRMSAEHYRQGTGPLAMHWLSVAGTTNVIAYVGTGPRSPQIARGLAGAWNLLLNHCSAALAASGEG